MCYRHVPRGKLHEWDVSRSSYGYLRQSSESCGVERSCVHRVYECSGPCVLHRFRSGARFQLWMGVRYWLFCKWRIVRPLCAWHVHHGLRGRQLRHLCAMRSWRVFHSLRGRHFSHLSELYCRGLLRGRRLGVHQMCRGHVLHGLCCGRLRYLRAMRGWHVLHSLRCRHLGHL